ncbi:MAG: alanine racemase [Candidatus Omnitrophica bacterium]|nr:alanine racemase [Candidatus Omnitrophota bacterium]MDD5081133.1 alanine racemase [Candidatus Omnitrophota bacterium]
MIRPAWVEINLDALKHNFNAIREFAGSTVKIIATIKQSAYGHGVIPIARQLSLMGVNYFGVGSVEEAIFLRDAGFSEPILVLSSVSSEFADKFVDYSITPTVVNLHFAKSLNSIAKERNKRCPVHVHIDTGMGRLGYYYKDAAVLVKELAELDNLYLEGIYTHFPSADVDSNFTIEQINKFNSFTSHMESLGITFLYKHSANSMGVLNYPQACINMIRPGLILYGISPVDSIPIEVAPVMALKSRVIFIKKVDKGMSVGYGRTYIAKRSVYIATVEIGYADGYPWSLSGKGIVSIKGRNYPVVGRVCMDHIMVELENGNDVKEGDEVLLFGRSGDDFIPVEKIARLANTIPYEIVSRLSLKLPRVYLPNKLAYQQ